MLNRERVKQLYKVALYEQKEEKLHKQIGKYYRSDYIGKEILKSIFTGTVAYFFLIVLLVANQWDVFLREINRLDVKEIGVPLFLVYLVYMVLYLSVTYFIYKARYEKSRTHLDEFEEEIRTLHNMYEREEKLK